MKNFPSVLESISDLSLQQIQGLLLLSKKFKLRQIDSTIFTNTRPIVANSFLENSTRTKNSFAIAISKLGCRYLDFNAQTSSLSKGESLRETLRTLKCQGVDLCILRSSESGILSEFKEQSPMKLINGGDGTHEHPTQALLDLFTMLEVIPELEGKTVAIIGDCVHSRVGHSLCELLPQFGCQIILIGPEEFLPSTAPNPHVTLSTHLQDNISKIDIFYSLRIQKERHGSTGDDQQNDYTKIFQNYSKNYGLSIDLLKRHKTEAPVFHPGPVNVGVELAKDILESPKYLGYAQVQNSIYMRMAIISTMLQNNDNSVGKFHESLNKSI